MTNHAVLHLHLLLWLFAYCCCSSWALYEPPCQASLGLRSGVIDDGLLYDISVSTGRPQDVRLDSPKAWQPLVSSPDNLIQVNMSRPVLLTGLQVQGNVGTDGWVSGWTLQTSLNCELFHSQDYELENENPYQSVMVPLKAMAFVSCLRIRPTGYHGAVPGMRLDLLGCVTSQSDHCQPHLSPTSELWLSGGGRELTYPHQLLLSWVRVSVKHKAESGTVGEVTLYHSRDCVSWEYYEPLDINVMSITSADKATRWVTLDLGTPVRAKCIRVFPPVPAKLGEVRTNGCSSRVTMGLHGASVGSPGNGRDEHRGGSELDDLSWYQDDSPRASTESETGNKETKSSTFKILEKSVKSPTTQLGQETNKETVSDPEGLKRDATAGEESVLNSDVQMDKPVSVFQQPITDPESSSSLSVQSSTLKATTRPSSADSQVLTTKNIISEKATSATLVETNTDNVLAQNPPNSEFADTSTNKSSNLLQGDELITMNDVTSSSDSPLNSTNTGTGSNGSSINYFDPTSENASHSSSDPTTTSSQQVNNSDKSESGEIRSEEQEVVEKVNSPLDTIDTDGHSKGDALSLHVIYFDDVTEDDLSDSDPQAQSDDVSNSTSANNSTTEGEDTSLTTACGVRTFSPSRSRQKRVIAGHRNEEGEWPWLVSLHFMQVVDFTNKSGYKHVCGASLLDHDWVLSAAHCFADEVIDGLSNLTNWEVYLGLNDLAREEDETFVQKRGIREVIPHPEFNLSSSAPLNSDIALIKLDRPVSFNRLVSPVCIDSDDLFSEESHCVVTGWGQLAANSTGSRYPYSSPLNLLGQEECKAKYDKVPDDHVIKQYVHILPPVVCASVGPQGEDACNGDSGGPLMCEHEGRWFQPAIVAAGYECGHKEFPGIYTRVSYFSDWIRDTMENYNNN